MKDGTHTHVACDTHTHTHTHTQVADTDVNGDAHTHTHTHAVSVHTQVADTDVNGDGTIDYEEFLAATIHQSKLQQVSECVCVCVCTLMRSLLAHSRPHLSSLPQSVQLLIGQGGPCETMCACECMCMCVCVTTRSHSQEEHLYKAFQVLDSDGSGFIDKSELIQALGGQSVDMKEMDGILQSVSHTHSHSHSHTRIHIHTYTRMHTLRTVLRR